MGKAGFMTWALRRLSCLGSAIATVYGGIHTEYRVQRQENAEYRVRGPAWRRETQLPDSGPVPFCFGPTSDAKAARRLIKPD
jgi:hypothetical protein